MRRLVIGLLFLFIVWINWPRTCLSKFPHQDGFYNKHSQYHNCYAYAFQDRNLNFTSKPQPGYKAKLPALQSTEYSCENFKRAIMADYPNIIDGELGCPCGYSKIFLALDTKGKFQDYHFYRQDINGLWSHKPGSLPVQTKDYAGNLIFDPETANRQDMESPDVNYEVSCGTLCVKR